MSNQWKMVPVEPTEEMNKAGMRWLTGIQHMRAGDKRNALNEAFKAMTDSAPVPPAGDVEVLGWIVSSPETKGFRASKTAYLQRPDWAYAEDNAERYAIHELVDRAEVTRLTAERDGLLAILESRKAKHIRSCQLAIGKSQLAKHLQSELTKARELFARMMGKRDACLTSYWFEEIEALLATPIAHNVEESCGQDAEAAKLEPAVDCGDCPIITDGCRGTCMKADRNTEWEDTFGPEYTGEDAEAAKAEQ